MTSAIARGLICHSGWGHKQFSVNPSHPRKEPGKLLCRDFHLRLFDFLFSFIVVCFARISSMWETSCHLTSVVVVVAFLCFSLGRSADDVDIEDAVHKVKGLQCVLLHLLVCCFSTPPHGQLHAVFGGFISSFFLEGGCCYASSLSWPKMVPT